MKLYYREYGSGTPLIILHGLYGSSDNWAAIARSLSNQFRVIVPDLRNHGRSPHNPVHTYEAMSSDIMELADSLQLQKVIIAGHSMGGKAAMWFAKRWPERVAGLIVMDMSPFRYDQQQNSSSAMHHTILKIMNQADLSSFTSREEAEKIFTGAIGSERIVKFLLKNLTRNRMGKFEWKLSPHNLLLNIDHIMDGFDRSELVTDPIKGFPVLFIRGEKSDYIPEEDIDDIAAIFPAAEFITIKGASHWLHAEEPQLITTYIRDFAS